MIPSDTYKIMKKAFLTISLILKTGLCNDGNGQQTDGLYEGI